MAELLGNRCRAESHLKHVQIRVLIIAFIISLFTHNNVKTSNARVVFKHNFTITDITLPRYVEPPPLARSSNYTTSSTASG
jgi:hypothetical protein